MSNLTGVIAGIGSCGAHLFDCYDSNDARKELNKNRKEVCSTGRHVLSLQPGENSTLAPSLIQYVKRSNALVNGAKISIFGACCNLFNGINNTLIAGLQYGDLSSGIFKKIHPIAVQASSGIAGATDVVNGYIQASTCFSAAKSWWREEDSASRDMYWWHMVNQGLQTVATLGRGASSFVGMAGIPVPLQQWGLGEVAPSIIGSIAAGVLSVGSNLICKNRIEAAMKRDNKNAKPHKAALEIQPAAKDVHMNLYQFASKKHPNDHVLATLAEQRPEKGFCAKYCCCCCSGRKQKEPAVKDEEQIHLEIVVADEPIPQSPSPQSPSPQSLGQQLHSQQSPVSASPVSASPVSASPNSPPPHHPFTESQQSGQERLFIT